MCIEEVSCQCVCERTSESKTFVGDISEAESGRWLTTSKEMGFYILKQNGSEFCKQLYELGR